MTLYALCMGYISQLLQLLRLLTVIIIVVSSQFWDGHDTQQLCAAFALVGISRQMLGNSVIYVGHDISIFLRRTWSLFSDSSLSLDVATVPRFVTLAGLDYFPKYVIYAGHGYHSRILLPNLDYILLVEFVERPLSR